MPKKLLICITFDGLAVLAENICAQSVFERYLFVFRNKRNGKGQKWICAMVQTVRKKCFSISQDGGGISINDERI